MHRNVTIISFTLILFSLLFQVTAAPDPNFHIYLLFGQSNMAGGAAGKYDGEGTNGVDDYCDTTSRVSVLAWGDCNTKSLPCPNMPLKRTHDQWYTAFPPYHNCEEGIGPADGFAKTLLDSISKDISIGFVPCALSGQEVEVFSPTGGGTIDSYTQPVPNIGNNGYKWMKERCEKAQQTGVIKGILFHQGESNSSGNSGVALGDAWVDLVAKIVKSLKTDLKLNDSIPFIAGEMRYDGCCKSQNTYVNKLPSKIPKCAVASAEGLERRLSRPDGQTDNYHFSTKGTKEFGLRYAKEFLKLATPELVPRVGTVSTTRPKVAPFMPRNIGSDAVIYTLNGKVIKSTKNSSSGTMKMKTPGVYIVIDKAHTRGRTAMVPFIQN